MLSINIPPSRYLYQCVFEELTTNLFVSFALHFCQKREQQDDALRFVQCAIAATEGAAAPHFLHFLLVLKQRLASALYWKNYETEQLIRLREKSE